MDCLKVPTVRLRYFSYNCFEIRLPNGKTLVIDPCLETEGRYAQSYGVEVLEGCDYVFVNHTHLDHVASLGRVYERFEPLTLCHQRVALDLAQEYDIPYLDVLPYGDGQSYTLDDFQITIVPGRHNDIGRVYPSGRTTEPDSLLARSLVWQRELTPLQRKLNDMGTLYNYNFLLTLPNHLRIGFLAGKPGLRKEEEQLWRQLSPDVVIAQRHHIHTPEFAEKMAHVLEVTGARILLPTHAEDAWTGAYAPEWYAQQVNLVCEEKGLWGRMYFPRQAQWFEIATTVACCEAEEK